MFMIMPAGSMTGVVDDQLQNSTAGMRDA